jgi:undecaprenyl-diphosphatase
MHSRFQSWFDRFRSVEPLTGLNFVVLLAAVSLFLVIADEVADGDHLDVEEAIMDSLRTGEPVRPAGPAWLARVARDVTALGSVIVLTISTLLVEGYLLLTRRFGAALFLVCAAAGGQSLNAALKYLYGRERPDPAFRWTEIDSLSFPSGHATSSAVIYLTLAVLLARLAEKNSHKAYIIGSAFLLSFFVGITRVYLGVHYPTDVIAGWAVGVVWAQFCWFVARAIGRRRLARMG